MDLGEVVFIFYQSLLSSVGKLASTQNTWSLQKAEIAFAKMLDVTGEMILPLNTKN